MKIGCFRHSIDLLKNRSLPQGIRVNCRNNLIKIYINLIFFKKIKSIKKHEIVYIVSFIDLCSFYLGVSLHKLREWTVQNSLRLVEPDIVMKNKYLKNERTFC